MNCDQKSCFSNLIGILFFGALAASPVQAAQKGTPGSLERAGWCQSKLDTCVEEANDDCDDTYFGKSTELALCKSSEVKVCKDAYGSTSDCSSRDRVSKGSRKTDAPSGQKAIAEPKRSSRPQKDKLKNGTATQSAR